MQCINLISHPSTGAFDPCSLDRGNVGMNRLSELVQRLIALGSHVTKKADLSPYRIAVVSCAFDQSSSRDRIVSRGEECPVYQPPRIQHHIGMQNLNESPLSQCQKRWVCANVGAFHCASRYLIRLGQILTINTGSIASMELHNPETSAMPRSCRVLGSSE